MKKTAPPILKVRFFRTDAGNEPVREWLRALPEGARKAIGADIRTVQFGWPLGMPLVRKVAPRLWEVRSRVRDGIARVLFTEGFGDMVLLHGFIKKSQKIPQDDIDLAKERLRMLEG